MYKKQKSVSFLYKRKLPSCSLCILLHGRVSRVMEESRVSVIHRMLSDLGLLNLILAVGGLYDVRVSDSADVAVMLPDGAVQRVVMGPVRSVAPLASGGHISRFKGVAVVFH